MVAVPDRPARSVGDWALETLAVHRELAAYLEETGVRMVAGVHLGERLAALGPWAARLADAVEVAEGLRVTLPLLSMADHLAWLERRLRAAGATVERRAVQGFGEAAAEAPVVVDCAGLGAAALAPDDGVRPVRGQLVVVENPGITEWFAAPDPATGWTTYAFPSPTGWCWAGRRRTTTGPWSRTRTSPRRSWRGARGSVP